MNAADIKKEFEESARVKKEFAQKYAEDIIKVGKVCVEAIKNNKKIMFCGNGGSAADSQHLAAELVGKYLRERKAMKGLALTTNTSNITAIGNDYDYKDIFKRQVEAWGEKGDVLIGISTSGNSQNVFEAIQAAKKLGVYTVGFLGNDGGKIGTIADFAFIVPSKETPRIQEVHITLGQVICNYIESTLFG